MKKFHTTQLIIFISLASVISTIAFSYLIAVLFAINGVSIGELGIVYFLQSFFWVLSTSFFSKKFFPEYFAEIKGAKKKTLNSFVFAICFSLFLLSTLLVMDYLISLPFNFGMSLKYGEKLDSLLENPSGITHPEESFQLVPLSLQNLLFNLLAFIVIFFISKNRYKKHSN